MGINNMDITKLRNEYHTRICKDIIRISTSSKNGDYPNFADGSNRNSISIAWGIVARIGGVSGVDTLAGQTTGGKFEVITKDFLEKSFNLLAHVRPGKWIYSFQTRISDFDQYEHLAGLERIIDNTPELASVMGVDYIIKPDIVIGKTPLEDLEINKNYEVLKTEDNISRHTPLRQQNNQRLILHASISCKWTLRSDRGQNARTEALNLIRNRKGNVPKIVAITGEPLPTRIASLALGTGDLDCVYHFALYELEDAVKELKLKDEGRFQDQYEELRNLIDGRRLRDISDLPFDLAI